MFLPQAPALSFQVGNTTVSASKVLSDLGPGLVVVPLIGFLESIAIAKAFARKNGYNVDPSQELIALGIANCLGSFVSSYPVTGSFSRTAVNAQSGVATPAGGEEKFINKLLCTVPLKSKLPPSRETLIASRDVEKTVSTVA